MQERFVGRTMNAASTVPVASMPVEGIMSAGELLLEFQILVANLATLAMESAVRELEVLFPSLFSSSSFPSSGCKAWLRFRLDGL